MRCAGRGGRRILRQSTSGRRSHDGRRVGGLVQINELSYDLASSEWSARFPAGDSPRTLVTAFGASQFGERPELFVELARAYPRSLMIGCSSAGEIHGAAVRD